MLGAISVLRYAGWAKAWGTRKEQRRRRQRLGQIGAVTLGSPKIDDYWSSLESETLYANAIFAMVVPVKKRTA
jgi:hypothetical protein